MSSSSQPHLVAEPIEGTQLRVLKGIPGPGGSKLTAVFHGRSVTLTNSKDPNQTIVITGSGTTVSELSLGGILDGIGDGIVAALGALKKLLSCTPKQTTQVNVGSDGKVT